MIYFIIAISLFLFLVSRMITVSSAPYLLSGYNTMTSAQQSQVDIIGLVGFWRKFHQYLAVFILVFGVGTYYLVDEDWSVIGSIVAILLAYGVSLSKSLSYYSSASTWNKYLIGIVQVILVGLSVFITVSYIYDTRESHIIWNEDSIEFTGYKGIQIPYKDISEVSIVSEALDVTSKIEGLGTSRAQKGHFTVKPYGPVHLLVTQKEPPYLMVRYGSGKKLIYNSPETDVDPLKKKLESRMYDQK